MQNYKIFLNSKSLNKIFENLMKIIKQFVKCLRQTELILAKITGLLEKTSENFKKFIANLINSFKLSFMF